MVAPCRGENRSVAPRIPTHANIEGVAARVYAGRELAEALRSGKLKIETAYGRGLPLLHVVDVAQQVRQPHAGRELGDHRLGRRLERLLVDGVEFDVQL